MAFPVAVIQLEIDRDSPDANRGAALTLCADAIVRGARAVLLPEAAVSDFYRGAEERAQTIPGPLTDAFQQIAGRALITLPLLESRDGKVFSACALIASSGVVGVARRTHLYRDPLGLDLFDERDAISAGAELSVHEFGGVRFGVALGFDAQFPETFRTLALKGADIVLCPLNSVEPDLPFLRAMAQCNRLPIAVANRLGFKSIYPSQPEFSATAHAIVQDKRGSFMLRCRGNSAIIGPDGKIEARAESIEPRETPAAPVSDRARIPNDFLQDEQILSASFRLEELRIERLTHPLLAARRPDLYLNS